MSSTITLILLLGMTTLLTPLQGMSQQSCSALFGTQKKSHDDATSSLVKLHNASDSIKDFINRSPVIDAAEFSKKIIETEKVAEEYFKSAQIDFDKIETSIPANTTYNDKTIPSISYYKYRLKGNKNGDSHSRLMLSIQQLKDLSAEAKVVLDPLHFINSNDTFAHYQPFDKTIYLQIDGLYYSEIGIIDAFRHEIQHHFEQVKMDQGKMSLARIMLFNMEAPSNGSYEKILRLDEIETHIRDLRFMLNIAPRNLENFLNVITSLGLTKEQIIPIRDGMEQSRTLVYQQSKSRLETMLVSSKSALINFQTQLTLLGENHFSYSPGYRNLTYEQNIQDTYYKQIRITAPADQVAMTQQALYKSILNTIVYSLNRIKSAELELRTLQSK